MAGLWIYGSMTSHNREVFKDPRKIRENGFGSFGSWKFEVSMSEKWGKLTK